MPAEDWPSFHCLPSTASTVLPASASMRHMPTTGSSDLGSAPAVSPEKSGLKSGAASAGSNAAAKPTVAATRTAFALLFMMMIYLVRVKVADDSRRGARHAKEESRGIG